MTRKQHIKKILAPTQSRDNPANLFMFMCFVFPWNLWTERLEYAPPEFTFCALLLPLLHGLCAFTSPSWHLSRQPPSWPASHFTVCASRFTRPLEYLQLRHHPSIGKERSTSTWEKCPMAQRESHLPQPHHYDSITLIPTQLPTSLPMNSPRKLPGN